MKLFLSIFFILFTFLISSKAYPYLEEEQIDDIWSIQVFTYDKIDSKEWDIIVQVNGTITHADSLRIRIPLLDVDLCNFGNTFTTFYTTADNANLHKITGKILKAKFNSEIINVETLYAIDFLLGYMVFIDMGWNNLDEIKQFFENESEIELILIDGNQIRISDYFDIPKNSFSLEGLNDALDRAREECIRIVNLRLKPEF